MVCRACGQTQEAAGVSNSSSVTQHVVMQSVVVSTRKPREKTDWCNTAAAAQITQGSAGMLY